MMNRYIFNGAISFLAFAILTSCGKWPDSVETARQIAKLSPDTKSIYTRELPDGDIPALTNLPQLSFIDFQAGWGACPEAQVTDRGLQLLAGTNLPKLETISLSRCSRITDEGLKHLAQIKSLRNLYLAYNPQITDLGIQYISAINGLSWIVLDGCDQLTDASLSFLSEIPSLSRIELSGCKGITPEAIARFKESSPNCRVISREAKQKSR